MDAADLRAALGAAAWSELSGHCLGHIPQIGRAGNGTAVLQGPASPQPSPLPSRHRLRP